VNNKIYDIDHNKLVTWITPGKIQKPRFLNLLKSLVYPVISLYLSFRRYRTAKQYQLKITPQVCYLEMMLNDRYDYVLRRIRIVDSIDRPALSIFTKDELKPVYLGSKYIYTSGEAGTIKDDYIVLVPSTIVFETAEMLSLLKSYQLAGMKPKIQLV
jgi:hypothetical protein